MWIRMISTAAGPRLPHALHHGSTYQVEDELGEELVGLRAAEEVANPNAKATAPAEAAVDERDDAGAEKKSETLIDKLKNPPKAESAKK